MVEHMVFEIMNKDVVVGVYDPNSLDTSFISLSYLSNSKKYILERFNNCEKHNTASNRISVDEFCAVSKCLSLNDTLWLKPLNCKINWDTVNPYKNPICQDFNNQVLKLKFNGILSGEKTISSPEYSLSGSYPKRWINRNGSTWLIKNSTPKPWKDLDSIGNEAFSELFSSLVAEVLGLSNYTTYFIRGILNTDKITNIPNGFYDSTSICKLFTSEYKGFMPQCDIDTHGLTPYQFATKMNSGKQFLEMCLLDSLTMNIDRHSGNYGYYINNDTLEILEMAPIFDNNLAFFPKVKLNNSTVQEIASDLKHLNPRLSLSADRAESFVVLGCHAIYELLCHRYYTPQELYTGIKRLQGLRFTNPLPNKLNISDKRLNLCTEILHLNSRALIYYIDSLRLNARVSMEEMDSRWLNSLPKQIDKAIRI